MPEYLSPGVYVEEVDRGPKPIEGVGTAMACFVGFTEKAQLVEQVDGETVTRDLLNKPQLVTNWTQYVERFGGFVDGAVTPLAVYGYFQNGGSRCYVVSVRAIPKAQAGLLNADGRAQLVLQSKQAGFGGMRLRARVEYPKLEAPAAPARSFGSFGSPAASEGTESAEPAADTPSSGGSASNGQAPFTLVIEREKLSGGWQAQETFKEVKLVEVTLDDGAKRAAMAFPNNRVSQLVDVLIPDPAQPLTKLWPREQQQPFTIENRLLAAPTSSEFQGDVMERSGVEGLEAIDDITMVVMPDLMTVMPGQKLDLNMVKAVQNMAIAHCERLKDRVAILDAPPNLSPQAVKKWRMDTAGFDSSYAALYYPWIQVQDPISNRPINIPSSGHMAGIWARNDNTRGVHKAPANEVVLGAVGLATNITKGEQDTLNPVGVNCIRAFPGRGIRVWGARTLSSNPAWRYLNVRRLFNMVEKSIENGTQWVVFEPNDTFLWSQVTRDVSAFLKNVWRDGALFGNSPAEAFYVKCDAELNPPEVRDLGRLVIEIGLAPVKPAEFVIFRISQWAGPGA
ncbi:MAG: phage tail sheath family protein [Anaerolineales bacterium]|nr:phage tail sheath family protein [Anaerolineales bacterium]